MSTVFRHAIRWGWIGYDAFFGNWFSYETEARSPGIDPLQFSGNVGIGAYSALILSQD
jgi:hypothetical protein